MAGKEWEREIEVGEMSVDVGSDGVYLTGPAGSEEMTPKQVEQLYQALIDYRSHSNLDWEWARQGSDWWK